MDDWRLGEGESTKRVGAWCGVVHGLQMDLGEQGAWGLSGLHDGRQIGESRRTLFAREVCNKSRFVVLCGTAMIVSLFEFRFGLSPLFGSGQFEWQTKSSDLFWPIHLIGIELPGNPLVIWIGSGSCRGQLGNYPEHQTAGLQTNWKEAGSMFSWNEGVSMVRPGGA